MAAKATGVTKPGRDEFHTYTETYVSAQVLKTLLPGLPSRFPPTESDVKTLEETVGAWRAGAGRVVSIEGIEPHRQPGPGVVAWCLEARLANWRRQQAQQKERRRQRRAVARTTSARGHPDRGHPYRLPPLLAPFPEPGMGLDLDARPLSPTGPLLDGVFLREWPDWEDPLPVPSSIPLPPELEGRDDFDPAFARWLLEGVGELADHPGGHRDGVVDLARGSIVISIDRWVQQGDIVYQVR